MRGQKPKSSHLRLISPPTGKKRLRRQPDSGIVATGRPKKPEQLRGRSSALWDEVLRSATWLTEPDGYLLWLWVELQSEFEAEPSLMPAARISQLRLAAASLGLDPSTRARLPAAGRSDPNDPAAKFLGLR